VEAALAGVLSLAISLLASFLGLGNVAGKVLALVEKVRAVVDRALDTAIAWIVGKAKALFAKLFGKAGKKEDQAQAGRADAPFRFMGHPHTLRLQEDGGRIAVLVASGAFSPFKQKLALLRANAIELDVSPDNLSKLDQAIAKASQFADSIAGKPLAGRALRDELKGGDIGAELDNVGADISEKWNTTVPLQTRVLYAHRVYRLTGHGAVSDLLSTGKPEFMAELTNQQGAQILVSYRYYRTTYSTESGTWINWSAGHPDGDRWIDPKTGLVRAEVDIRDDLYWKGNWPSANLGWKKAQIANAKARARDPARKPLLDAYLSRVPGAGQNVIYLPAVPGFGEKMWDATNDASVHIDHIVPLGEHWLSGHGSAPGNDSEHDARRTFYLDSSNHQILDGPTNSAKGGDHFVRTVKPGFRGPT
jgi:hypothetical protein